jgi:hypothetical protein
LWLRNHERPLPRCARLSSGFGLVHACGDIGHRIICGIPFQELEPTARERVKAMIRGTPTSSSSATEQQKLEALKYLGHWFGDIHQPLHVSSRTTAAVARPQTP